MNAEELRALQSPVKQRFKENPETAKRTLVAQGTIQIPEVMCQVRSYLGEVPAGLHELTGGDGSLACSANMLLESLVGCAGVTLSVVATAMGIAIRSASLRVEGDLDFRGTMGVDRTVPVGFSAIRIIAQVDSDAPPEQLAKLLELTERYCVVQQTLANGVPVSIAQEKVV